jgi:hypothetical protein
MKYAVFCDMTWCGSYKNRSSEERIASIIRVEAMRSSKTSVFTNHILSFQKSAFFTVTATTATNATHVQICNKRHIHRT